MPNTWFIKGMYKITKCKIIEKEIATSNHGFNHTGIESNELSSEIAFMALNISITTKTVKLRVQGLVLKTVKYEHGSFDKSKPEKLLTEKPVQV